MRRRGFLFLMLIFFMGCNDDKNEGYSIIGQWHGTRLDYVISKASLPISLTHSNEDFDAIVDFNANGTINYHDNSQTATGTYEIQNNTLITTLELPGTTPLSTGRFSIKKLNASELELYALEEGVIEVPDYGTFEGTLKATLHFIRENR